jgi:hypothetical protein
VSSAKKGPKIAILLADPKETKKFSSIFKSLSLTPICLNDLEAFLQEIEKNRPSLSIVDVLLMSKRELLLKNHHLIKSGQIPLAFYYAKESSPLTISTYDIFHMGLIQKSSDYNQVLKPILKRTSRFWALENEKQNLKGQLERSHRLNLKATSLKTHFKVINHFLRFKNQKTFFHILEKAITQWPEVEEYSWYQLDHKGQKLVCPQISTFKFLPLKQKNLGKNNLQGISPDTSKIALNEVLNVMKGGVIPLEVVGHQKYPDILIFLKTHKALNDFNWQFLENFLNVLYLFKKETGDLFSIHKDLFIGPWQMFSLLDEGLYQSEKKYSLVDLNLSYFFTDLIHHKNHFFWNKFLKDFIVPLEKVVPFKVSCPCPGNLLFITDWKDGNHLFDTLKEHSKKFPFWSYFKSRQNILAKNVDPVVKMVPSSVGSYLQHLAESSPFLKERLSSPRPGL